MSTTKLEAHPIFLCLTALGRNVRRKLHVPPSFYYLVQTGSLLLFVFIASRLDAQLKPELQDTLHRIFATKELEEEPFGPARWLEGGKAYTTLEPSSSGPDRKDIVRYDTESGRREIFVSASRLVPPNSRKPLEIDDYFFSDDLKRLLISTNTTRIWRLNTRGDYWVLDLATGKLWRLGGDAPPQTLMFAKFSSDGSRVAYVRENNIYVESLDTGRIQPLTQDGSDTIINGTSDWVYEEEFFLRDAFRWSPDGKRIAYWRFDTSGVRDFPLLYNTGGRLRVITHVPYPQFGLYPTVQHYVYPQPGTTNSAVSLGVVSAEGGPTRWLNVPGDPRDNYIPRADWTPDSRDVVLEHMNRLQNTNDVLLADPDTGMVRRIYRDQDAAWVDIMGDLTWLRDGRELLWLSEHEGWRHAYAIPRDSGAAQLITRGDFDVISLAGVDPSCEWLYFMASPRNATERYLYRTGCNSSSGAERTSPAGEPGTHSYQISPDYHWAFHSYSRFGKPSTIDLIRLPGHETSRTIVSNDKLRSAVNTFGLAPVEFFQVDVGNGVSLDAWMIKPLNFDQSKKYPLLLYVYGEPASQTVTDEWHGQNGLFHQALAKEGYLIASVDNQGTPAPKGRAWRKIVYGSVGLLSSKQQAAALEILERTRPYIDASRVAVWGASGGGSNTLNLMFRYPDLYKVGMAVAPVPDQRLYDTIYQERFMGLPEANPDGYRSGSAINFAEGLRGHLLIVHGSGDDNVHYQGTELLMNRLIELGKQFDFMEYPNRTHSFSEGEGTQLHLFILLARYLEEHVPPGPVPR